ncbi:MAG: MBOAT family O-acyltransferase, partial [Oscillospiraceae bacterium]
MVFSSLTFLYFFLPVIMILYFFAGTKVRNVILLVSGLLFYAWGEPFYIVIMLISTLIDYTAGRLMDKFDDDDKKRRACLLVSVIMNVGLLSIFKYSNFIFDNISSLVGQTVTNPFVSVNKWLNGIFPFELNEKRIDLPIGISFFTFQSMSYTIDLYLRKIKVQKSFLSFAAYISMFPQIVAGPIVRYEDVAAEIDNRSVNMSKISIGITYFIKGLAKKVLLANNIGAVWTEIKALDYGEISMLTAWIGILAFTFQIYFDFSGYSDMAV